MGTLDRHSLNETLKRAVMAIESNTDQTGRVQPRATATRSTTMTTTATTSTATAGDGSLIGVQLAARQSEQQLRGVFNQLLCVAGAMPQNEMQALARLSEQVLDAGSFSIIYI